MTAEYVLELGNVFHSGQVEPGTCLQKLVGSVRTGVILKDVSLEVHGGELTAILGSKGSGKRALLEVISRRAQGPTRGQILLNGVPMSMRLFQESCGYVTQKCDLLPALSVRQTLMYAAHMTIGTKVSAYVKNSRVKQVLADLALSQFANRAVATLSQSEYRRLIIGTQLVRDPVVLLLDEPTWDLDPLNTYFIVSILSNHAKKYNRIVVLTMEKPRSDIFPFLDRVTYLCLGDVVYTGATRMMLDYFRSIGFPCPELENPLMYYLCLSTVDRRSRERFIESNNQISALVEKFKLEGGPYRKYAGPVVEMENIENHQKIPLTAYGRPGFFVIFFQLLSRFWGQLYPFRGAGLRNLLLKLFLMPAFFFLLWVFYMNAFFEGVDSSHQFQRTYVTRNGLVFNSLAGAYFMAIIVTAATFGSQRTRYYQEAREGIYTGPTFLLTHFLQSLPLSAFTSCLSAFITFRGLKEELLCHRATSSSAALCEPLNNLTSLRVQQLTEQEETWTENGYFPDFLLYWLTLWSCFMFAEQQTIAFMVVIKSTYTAALCSIYLTIIYLILGSGTVRSMSGLPEMMYHLTYIIQTRYSGAVLNGLEFYDSDLPGCGGAGTCDKTSLLNLGTWNSTSGLSFSCFSKGKETRERDFGCRYLNGTMYADEKYKYPGVNLDVMLDGWTNTAISFAFPGVVAVLNTILYLVPLPAFVKAKFRE